MKRIFLFVLDSFGIGAMPDSENLGMWVLTPSVPAQLLTS